MGHESSAQVSAPDASPRDGGKPKLTRKEYEEELRKLQTELCSCRTGSRRPASGSSSSSKAATPPARAERSGR